MHRNNILNPAPLSRDAQNLQRPGGRASFGQAPSEAAGLIFPTQQAHASPGAALRPSIQMSGHQGNKYHHHSSQIVMQDYDPSSAPPKQMNDQQVSALSDIQQRIMQQNKEMDSIQSHKSSQMQKPPMQQIQAQPSSQGTQNLNLNQPNVRASQNQLSEGRRNQATSNFRAAGEQAIRNSSTNRPSGNEGGIQMEQPGGLGVARQNSLGPPAASKPSMPPAETAKPVTLEPIENYKGKSLAELEAILDTYNAQKETTNVVQYNPSDEGANKPVDSGPQPAPAKRNRSQAVPKPEESKEAPLKNSVARRQSGVRRDSRGQPGTRPPMIPSGRMKQDKENMQGEPRKNYGKVPKYLQKFNQARVEKEQQKLLDEENKKCPPGTRKMPEDERQAMLKELNETKRTLEAEMMKFPISMKTVAIQKKRDEMEAQLDKIENSIKVFSKETVFVQM